MEFGTGFFGFEVGEIYIFFFFIFLGIFSQFWPSISEFTSFQSIFQSGNFYFFLLDIFISARKYRIAPSTVDGRVYFHSRISYVGIRFLFSGKFINSSSFFIVVSVYLVRVSAILVSPA